MARTSSGVERLHAGSGRTTIDVSTPDGFTSVTPASSRSSTIQCSPPVSGTPDQLVNTPAVMLPSKVRATTPAGATIPSGTSSGSVASVFAMTSTDRNVVLVAEGESHTNDSALSVAKRDNTRLCSVEEIRSASLSSPPPRPRSKTLAAGL